MKISLKGLFLIAIILIGCQEDEPEAGCTFGTIVDATGLDGCGWIIELNDGTRLEPTNLEDFEITLSDGRLICMEYEEATDLNSFCMVGKMVEIASIVDAPRIY